VINHAPKYFFVNGPSGTGKIFLYNTLLTNIRSRGEIALAVTSFRIATLLITGGRTAHSWFKILIKLEPSSTCNISQRSKETYLINVAKLIIWDEALMIYKFTFEAVNRTFRDITQIDEPFEQKTFVFEGNFYQVLPVISHFSHADIVSASLN